MTVPENDPPPSPPQAGCPPMLIIDGGIASSIAGSTIYKKVKSNVYG